MAKMFDLRVATVFFSGYRLSKHNMTRYAKHFGGRGRLGLPGNADEWQTQKFSADVL